MEAEKAMAPHSSTLAWKIPWMEEPGGLQSMGSRRVVHDWATLLSFSLLCIGEGNGNPPQCSCLENPRDGGAWWAAVCGVAQSWTRLKRLSRSSSSSSGWRKFIKVVPLIFLQENLALGNLSILSVCQGERFRSNQDIFCLSHSILFPYYWCKDFCFKLCSYF